MSILISAGIRNQFKILILFQIRSSSLTVESGLNRHLRDKILTVSTIALGEQAEKAKIYYSMSAYVEDNTRSFTELKLNYFWYLFHFTVFVPLLLLGFNVLEKTRFVRRRWAQLKAIKSKRRRLKV